MPKAGWIGAVAVVLYGVMAIGGGVLAPMPAAHMDHEAVLKPPSTGHWMGTDHLGRDVLSRLIAGTRTTLGLAALVAGISSLIALVLGGWSGFAGGWVDAVVMRLADVVLALPGFLLAVGLLGLLGGGAQQLVILLAATGWAPLARIVRNEIAVVQRLDFVVANRALGYSMARNLFMHAVPAVLPSLFIFLLNALIGDVFAIVSLSFLGLGVSPQVPEWGTILFDGRSYFLSSPWLFLFPSAAVTGLALGLHLLADGLRECFDTKRLLAPFEEVKMHLASRPAAACDPA